VKAEMQRPIGVLVEEDLLIIDMDVFRNNMTPVEWFDQTGFG